jgi:hypothetical protein
MMATQTPPERAFPDEILDLRDEGVPLPAWYSGPLYQGNGPEAAKNQLARLMGSEPDRVIEDIDAEIEELSAPLPSDLAEF